MKRQLLKDLIPLSALAVGILLSHQLAPLSQLIPYAISAMLFLTFLKVSPRDLRLRATHLVLLCIQLLLVVGAYWLLPKQTPQQECLVLLFLTPAASAAPAIVQLLSGNTGFTASYTLLSHAMIILVAPILLPVLAPATAATLSFSEQALQILRSIAPLIVPPIAIAWALAAVAPRQAETLGGQKQLAFSIWLASLILLMAHTTETMKAYSDSWSWSDIIQYALISFAACAIQFSIGALLGRILSVEPHSIRQALGQKNTTLGLWLATLFLSPLTPIAVASYIVWQNFVITYMMARRQHVS